MWQTNKYINRVSTNTNNYEDFLLGFWEYFFTDLKKDFIFLSCAVFCMLCHTKHILYNLYNLTLDRMKVKWILGGLFIILQTTAW